MPFILPSNDCNATFEKFKSIIEKYQQVIETDDTARCMVGFTAASMIRNKEGTDLDSFERWLLSVQEQPCYKEYDYDHTKVHKILHVMEAASTRQYDDDEEEFGSEVDSNSSSVIERDDSADELDRYTSRNPFSSKQSSYPNYAYVPDRTFVTLDNERLFVALEDSTVMLG
jgi:hypothetical protein